MFQVRVLILVVLLVSPSTLSQAWGNQKAYGRWIRNNTQTVINNVKKRLYPHLSSEERRIVRSIQFRFSPIWNINAYAYLDGSHPVVRFDLGYLAVIDQLSIAYITENELGYSGCYRDFARRLIDTLNKNTEQIRNRMPPSYLVVNVWGLGKDSNSACYRVTSQEFNRDLRAGYYYSGGVEGSLVFMILHEIAHHVLGHVRIPHQQMTLTRSRKQETAADEWAFLHALDIQVNPVAGLSSWIFFSAMDGTDITQEFSRSHPISLNRFKRMLETILKRAKNKEDYANTFGEPLPEDIAMEIRRGLEKIEALLAN